MKQIFASKYSAYFIAGLILTIICAWFSLGHHQADEYYQVLEFCNYKLGRFPEQYMPWEFRERMRSTILPLITYGIARGLLWAGIYNPYTLTFILRLIIGFAYWFVVCRLCLFLLPKLKTALGQKLFVLMSLLIWYVPYIAVRFTPENISGLLLLWGFYSIMSAQEENKVSFKSYLLAGLLFGIAVFIRIQISFAIAGFVAWLLFINKTKLKYLFALAVAAIVAIGLNVIIDHWFYHVWTFSPVNYFTANIIQHKSDLFGVEPWWFYFLDFTFMGIPPLSIILLVIFIAGLIKNRRDPLVWTIVPFLIVHFAIGHKEIRFLYSVAFIFTYIAALGFEYFNTKPFYQRIHKYVYATAIIVCIPLLIYRLYVPACTTMSYFKYLYYNAPKENTPVFCLTNDFSNGFYHLDKGFYMRGNLTPVFADSASQVEKYLEAKSPPTAFFIGNGNYNNFKGITGYKIDMVYTYYPDWIQAFNFNNWVERSSVWKIYRFTRIN